MDGDLLGFVGPTDSNAKPTENGHSASDPSGNDQQRSRPAASPDGGDVDFFSGSQVKAPRKTVETKETSDGLPDFAKPPSSDTADNRESINLLDLGASRTKLGENAQNGDLLTTQQAPAHSSSLIPSDPFSVVGATVAKEVQSPSPVPSQMKDQASNSGETEPSEDALKNVENVDSNQVPAKVKEPETPVKPIPQTDVNQAESQVTANGLDTRSGVSKGLVGTTLPNVEISEEAIIEAQDKQSASATSTSPKSDQKEETEQVEKSLEQLSVAQDQNIEANDIKVKQAESQREEPSGNAEQEPAADFSPHPEVSAPETPTKITTLPDKIEAAEISQAENHGSTSSSQKKRALATSETSMTPEQPLTAEKEIKDTHNGEPSTQQQKYADAPEILLESQAQEKKQKSSAPAIENDNGDDLDGATVLVTTNAESVNAVSAPSDQATANATTVDSDKEVDSDQINADTKAKPIGSDRKFGSGQPETDTNTKPIGSDKQADRNQPGAGTKGIPVISDEEVAANKTDDLPSPIDQVNTSASDAKPTSGGDKPVPPAWLAPPLNAESEQTDSVSEEKSQNNASATKQPTPPTAALPKLARVSEKRSNNDPKQQTPGTSNTTIASRPPAPSQPTKLNAANHRPPSDASVNPSPNQAPMSTPPGSSEEGSEASLAPLTADASTVPANSQTAPLQNRVQSLENELNAAHNLIQQLQHRKVEEEKASDAVLVELQANLQSQMTKRAEAEDTARRATVLAKKVTTELDKLKKDSKAKIKELSKDLAKVSKEKTEMQVDFVQIRDERDEQARKEMALTNRLNAAKKKEAVKANAAEHYEDQVDYFEKQFEKCKRELTSVTAERAQLKKEVADWKQYAEQRTKQLESALHTEKTLNDERKRKMKGFVEAKMEEVRSAKADNISLQTELDQTNRSLKELNQRHKQLHTQWVQSQTRSREVQRDMTKMKKDSEQMSKIGGSLEAKLSRSAMQTEDHKNKRLAAKSELMAVLTQLEVERDFNHRLRESVKVKFTPQALSQQQTIQEALDDFEGALQKLATRLRRPLLPPPVTGNDLLMGMTSEQMLDAGDEAQNGIGEGVGSDKRDDSDGSTTKVLTKLENETQRVSQCIHNFTTSIERMHALLEGSSNRSCVDAVQQLFVSRGAQNEETTSMTGARRARGARYGQVPRGAMT